MRSIINFFALLQVQAIAAVPMAKMCNDCLSPAFVLIVMLAWLIGGLVTIGFLHTAVLREIRRRDDAEFIRRRDS